MGLLDTIINSVARPALALALVGLLGTMGLPAALLQINESVRAIATGSCPQVASNDLFFLREGAIYSQEDLGEEQKIFAQVNATAVAAARAGSSSYLAWETAQGIYFSKKTSGNWSLPTQITGNGKDTDLIIVADSSRIYLLWSRQITSGNSEIFLRSFAGGSWQPVQQISQFAGESVDPAGSFASDGTFYLIWTDNRKGQEQPWLRYKDSDGWSKETLMVADPNNGGEKPQVAAVGTTVYLSFIRESKCYLRIGSGLSFSDEIAISDDTNDLVMSGGSLLCIVIRKNAKLYFKTKSARGWSTFVAINLGSSPDIWVKENERTSCVFVYEGTICYIDLVEQAIVDEGEFPTDYDEKESFDDAYSSYYKKISFNESKWKKANEAVRENFFPKVWDWLNETGVPILQKISQVPLLPFILIIIIGTSAIILVGGFAAWRKRHSSASGEEEANGSTNGN